MERRDAETQRRCRERGYRFGRWDRMEGGRGGGTHTNSDRMPGEERARDAHGWTRMIQVNEGWVRPPVRTGAATEVDGRERALPDRSRG